MLRTYRHAALWKRKTESECQQGFFAAIPAACRKMPSRAKCVPTYGQLGAPKSRLERPKSRKKRPKGATNAARREKCTQEALKSEKCANIEPTWRNFGLRAPCLNLTMAPPSKLMQKLKSNKCLWALTRLALQAARRIFSRFFLDFGRVLGGFWQAKIAKKSRF